LRKSPTKEFHLHAVQEWNIEFSPLNKYCNFVAEKRKLTLKNSSEYKGDTVDGEPHGKGKMSYGKGAFYEGDFVYGELHGKGKAEAAESLM
jgi:hypothetical protein